MSTKKYTKSVSNDSEAIIYLVSFSSNVFGTRSFLIEIYMFKINRSVECIFVRSLLIILRTPRSFWDRYSRRMYTTECTRRM